MTFCRYNDRIKMKNTGGINTHMKVTRKFFKDNPMEDIPLAQVVDLRIRMFKMEEAQAKIHEVADRLKPQEQLDAEAQQIAAVQAVQTPDELINLMRKIKGTICHEEFTRKALSMEEEALPKIVERFCRNMTDCFLEASEMIFFYADRKYLDELLANYKEIRSPYAQSIVCLLIGMAEYKDVDEFLMNEYQRFKKDYPDEIYSQFPLYALQLLHPELL